MKQRLKNLYFWLGIIGIIMMQLGLSEVHTWVEVGNVLLDLLNDPSRLLSFALVLTGMWTDPTTPGFRDREKLEEKTKE